MLPVFSQCILVSVPILARQAYAKRSSGALRKNQAPHRGHGDYLIEYAYDRKSLLRPVIGFMATSADSTRPNRLKVVMSSWSAVADGILPACDLVLMDPPFLFMTEKGGSGRSLPVSSIGG